MDKAIVAFPVLEPSLAEVATFSEDFVLVRPSGDADQLVPSPEMLREMRFLQLEEGHFFRDHPAHEHIVTVGDDGFAGFWARTDA